MLEWEGFEARQRPGWLHPAVYVLTAACYTYDMERRRLTRMSDTWLAVQRWCQELGGSAVRVVDAALVVMQRVSLLRAPQ